MAYSEPPDYYDLSVICRHVGYCLAGAIYSTLLMSDQDLANLRVFRYFRGDCPHYPPPDINPQPDYTTLEYQH